MFKARAVTFPLKAIWFLIRPYWCLTVIFYQKYFYDKMDLRLFHFYVTNCPSSNYSSIQPSVFQRISNKNVISDSENLPIWRIQAVAPAVPDMFELLSLYHHILHIYSHQIWAKGRFGKGVLLKINLTGTDNIFFWLHDFEKSYQPIYQGAALTKFGQLVPLETLLQFGPIQRFYIHQIWTTRTRGRSTINDCHCLRQ